MRYKVFSYAPKFGLTSKVLSSHQEKRLGRLASSVLKRSCYCCGYEASAAESAVQVFSELRHYRNRVSYYVLRDKGLLVDPAAAYDPLRHYVCDDEATALRCVFHVCLSCCVKRMRVAPFLRLLGTESRLAVYTYVTLRSSSRLHPYTKKVLDRTLEEECSSFCSRVSFSSLDLVVLFPCWNCTSFLDSYFRKG